MMTRGALEAVKASVGVKDGTLTAVRHGYNALPARSVPLSMYERGVFVSGEAAEVIPVTSVQLHPVEEAGVTKAIGSVTIGNAFVIHGVRVVDSGKGPFVTMPQRKEGDRYRDVAHPVNAAMRGVVAASVLEEYERVRQREERDRKQHSR